MTPDPKCRELADLFIDLSYEGQVREALAYDLAQTIQTAIDEWVEGLLEEEAKEAELDAAQCLRR